MQASGRNRSYRGDSQSLRVRGACGIVKEERKENLQQGERKFVHRLALLRERGWD
jgi:hypothetical protein